MPWPFPPEPAQTLHHLEAARREALARGNQNQAAWTYIYAGDCHLRLGDAASAVRSFAAAADLWPGDDPLCELGKALAQRHDFAGAERVRQRLVELARSEATEAHRQYLRKLEGEIAFARGDLDSAAALLEACLPSYLFNLDARFTLGLTLRAKGDLEGARREFAFLVTHRYSTLLEGHASLWPLAHYHLGLIAEAAGDSVEAGRQFERFVRLWGGVGTRLPAVPEVLDARRRLAASGRNSSANVLDSRQTARVPRASNSGEQPRSGVGAGAAELSAHGPLAAIAPQRSDRGREPGDVSCERCSPSLPSCSPRPDRRTPRSAT